MKAARLVLCVAALAAAQDRRLDTATIDRIAAEEVETTKVPGAAIAIVRGDKLIYSNAFGVANKETKEPARAEMLFRLGSTTKMLTSAAVVSLALEGKLDLRAPVERYVTALDPAIGRLTLDQLLSHTAGLKDDAVMDGFHDDAALGAGVRQWKSDWLFTEPGAVFSYSNPGYWLAGYVAEVVAGKPYADVMAERVFRPLGMKRTTLRPLMAMTYPLAQGHNRAGTLIRPAPDNTANWPAGSVFTSVEEFARVMIALLNDGRVDGTQVLPAKLIALLTAPQHKTPDPGVAYGYGLNITERGGIRIIDHGGDRAGYGSYMAIAPEHRVGVMVVTNQTGTALRRTAEAVLQQLTPFRRAEASPQPAVLPMDERERARYAGVYVNGDQKMTLVNADGKLIMSGGGGPKVELAKISSAELAARLPNGRIGARVRIISGADGAPAYLYIGERALKLKNTRQ